MSWISDVRGEVAELDISTKSLRKFGVTVGPIFVLIALFLLWRRRHLLTVEVLAVLGVTLTVAGLTIPNSLRGLYRGWMGMAAAMGWVMSRVIITLLFALVVTPIAMVARVFGKRFLDTEIRPKADTYWVAKTRTKAIDYEKLY